jgi:hypothetical protein
VNNNNINIALSPRSPLPHIFEQDKKAIALEPIPSAELIASPKDTISIDFMKTLIRIQTELLLDDIALLNNLRELGDKVIYRVRDLVEMIEILTGVKDINIITEEPITKCGCKMPVYTKIKSIALNKSVQFLNTEVAVRLQEEFKISLEYAINREF